MAVSQITIFTKSACDFSDSNVSATASLGNVTAPNVLDRKNTTAWLTTGSVDADNPTVTINMIDQHDLTDVLLLSHNFAAYTVKYWNGSAWTDFAPAINVSGNAATSTRHSFAKVTTATQLQLTVTGTIVPNSDKQLCQFIGTTLLGQFNGWPVIQKPTIGRNKKASTMLSGKLNIASNTGGVKMTLTVPVLSNTTDLALIQTLFDSSEGFLVWPGGGNESQFNFAAEGYRLQDIFLMQCQNDWQPEFYQGLYRSGIPISMQLAEVNA